MNETQTLRQYCSVDIVCLFHAVFPLNFTYIGIWVRQKMVCTHNITHCSTDGVRVRSHTGVRRIGAQHTGRDGWLRSLCVRCCSNYQGRWFQWLEGREGRGTNKYHCVPPPPLLLSSTRSAPRAHGDCNELGRRTGLPTQKK